MKKIILVCGLPGSGKTTLAEKITDKLKNVGYTVNWYNADFLRQKLDDWDFSYDGRLRQATRMKECSDKHLTGYVIIDMVAPLPEFRDVINPNITIWVDTINTGRFENTNNMFEPPENYHFRVTDQNAEFWSTKIVNDLTTNYIDLLTTL